MCASDAGITVLWWIAALSCHMHTTRSSLRIWCYSSRQDMWCSDLWEHIVYMQDLFTSRKLRFLSYLVRRNVINKQYSPKLLGVSNYHNKNRINWKLKEQGTSKYKIRKKHKMFKPKSFTLHSLTWLIVYNIINMSIHSVTIKPFLYDFHM